MTGTRASPVSLAKKLDPGIFWFLKTKGCRHAVLAVMFETWFAGRPLFTPDMAREGNPRQSPPRITPEARWIYEARRGGFGSSSPPLVIFIIRYILRRGSSRGDQV